MKSNMNHSYSVVARGEKQTDTTKLASLLALAAGAVALPQTSQADIIYQNLNDTPGVVGPAGDALFLFDLPGDATVGFQRLEGYTYTQTGSLTINYRFVLAGDINGADAIDNGVLGDGGIAKAIPFGGAWSQGLQYYSVPVGIVNDLNASSPAAGYERQYLAWFFEDSTQGNTRFYGWAEVSLSMASYNLGGPTVTVWGYAYDDTGAQPTMGQGIPEPSSGALLVMGAMALGARGLRKWRQSRPSQNPA
jgi:hypothetical protein